MKNNPWTMAYDHPAFKQYTKDEIRLMSLGELQEIYSYEA